MPPQSQPPPTAPDVSEFILKPIDEVAQTLPDKMIRHRRPLTGFLSSLFLHTTLLLILLLRMYSTVEKNPGIRIRAEIEAHNNQLTEQPATEDLNQVQIEIPDDQSSPLNSENSDVTNVNDTPLAELETDTVHPVKENNPHSSAVENLVAESPRLTLPAGGSLTGRNPTARGALAAEMGGSLASEMAVENGLRWIVAHQGKDGSWGFHHHKIQGCQCPNHGDRESKTAATGLSLLALLGAGYTHQHGPYQAAVERGLSYLMKTMRPNGAWLGDSDKMYAHAIATIALAEAYQMTSDKRLAEAVEKARKYIQLAQNTTDSKRKGSWGYAAGTAGDITVTGWHLMALKSCQAAGFPTPIETWKLTERFIDQMGSSEGTFGYDQPAKITPATTAIGLYCKMHLGMHRESPTLALGGDWLIEKGMSLTDIYYDYYATQVLFHRQGEDWIEWNRAIRDHLIATQVVGNGHLEGSWHFDDPHGKVGGRLYTTAMAIMTLEVYYRYLPLYENLSKPQSIVPQVSDTGSAPTSR